VRARGEYTPSEPESSEEDEKDEEEEEEGGVTPPPTLYRMRFLTCLTISSTGKQRSQSAHADQN
jgi:hypothetical protein